MCIRDSNALPLEEEDLVIDFHPSALSTTYSYFEDHMHGFYAVTPTATALQDLLVSLPQARRCFAMTSVEMARFLYTLGYVVDFDFHRRWIECPILVAGTLAHSQYIAGLERSLYSYLYLDLSLIHI